MKFALAQINPTLGDCAGNTRKIQQKIEEAAATGATLVVFPELAITGYPPQDLLDVPSLVESNEHCLRELARSATSISAVVGFVERNPSPNGKPFFNSAALLQKGKLAGVYSKRLLPTYDVFDDERYFEAGTQPFSFDLQGQKFALSICEDAWNFPGFLPRGYPQQPLEDVRGADWVVNLSASPFHLGKPNRREALFREITTYTGAGLLFCNQIGANDDLIFDGGSTAMRANGELLARGDFFREGLVLVDSRGSGAVVPPPGSDAQWLEEALVLGIRDYVRKSGAQRVCLGLSGGIDSSVVAVLAVKALGAAKVKGILLPTRYTSEASNQDALALARSLGIETATLSIESLFQDAAATLEKSVGHRPQGLTLENLQPRLRMTLLMAVANEENRLLLNTTNKSELAAGYGTVYGDLTGAIAVLGDLTKHQVYSLAQYWGSKSGISERVVQRAPSAELRENQKDEDSLPAYAELDPIVEEALEASADGKTLLESGHPKAAVETFLKLYRPSEYKRRQAPPILRVSPRAFGRGRRIPVASSKPW